MFPFQVGIVVFSLLSCLSVSFGASIAAPEMPPEAQAFSDSFPEVPEVPAEEYVPNGPIYPFQQYVQVRKSYTVQHLPQPESSDHIYHEAPSHGDDGAEGDYTSYSQTKPLLLEEISDYQKQEVYEEKGFKDSAYDHASYNYNYDHHNQLGDGHDGGNANAYQSSPSSHHPRKQKKNPQYQRLHADGTSTDILSYAESTQYDADAHRMGIYAARAGIYCPEVIDFNLDPETGDGSLHSQRNPKLRGLGDKISCLKTKYWGAEPLPSAIFQAPSESKLSLIKFGTMEDFMNEVHKNVNQGHDFSSSFGGGGEQIGFLG